MARRDQCLGGGNAHLARRAEILEPRPLHRAAQIARDDFAPRRHSDIVEHRLAPMAVFGRMDGGDFEAIFFASRQQHHDDRRGDFLGDDQQRPAAFLDQREDAIEFVDRLNLMIGHQNKGIIEHDLHPLDVGDHVVREIAALETHAFDDFQSRLHRCAEFDGDNAVIAGALERLRHHLAKLGVIGGDAGDGAQTLGAVEARGRTLKRQDRFFNRQFQAFNQFDGIGALRQEGQTVLHHDIGEHGRGGGAIAGDLVGLLGNFAQHLRAHILERAFQLDFAGDAHAVARDDRRADWTIHYRVHAFGAERARHRTGQFGDAAA